jgi:pimeloyl-ACP methyl ester carboxylesterase
MFRKRFLLGLCLFAVGVAFGGLAVYTPDASLAALESKYSKGASRFVYVLGIRVHVSVEGPHQAPTIILLHGFGSHLRTWDAWAEALKAQYRIVRFDLPGLALTGPDPSNDYSDTRSIDVVGALMDELQIDRAVLIGNSMGGRIAWRFAASQPHRVEKLVLIAPDGFAREDLGYNEATDVPRSLNILAYVLPKSFVRLGLSFAYGDPSRLSDEVVDRYHGLLLAPGVRKALIERQRQLKLANPETLLPWIAAPTLLLWGEKDPIVHVRNAEGFLRWLPKSKLVTFPKLGHLPHEEAPVDTLPALLDFLAQ